jgi:hypothetical protein
MMAAGLAMPAKRPSDRASIRWRLGAVVHWLADLGDVLLHINNDVVRYAR